jgi:hypothetical protein
MKLSLRQNAVIKRMKSEIAFQYGVKDFEDIEGGRFASRVNNGTVKNLCDWRK